VSAPQASPIAAEDLRAIGLFGALSDGALEGLCRSLGTLDAAPGDLIFREGEPGQAMYVVLSGELEVLKRSRTGHESRVALLGVRDWFGEMSVLDMLPRSASVRAVSASTLLVLTSSDLDALYRRDLKAYTLVVQNIARELSRRLRVADGLLAEIVLGFQDTYLSR
jgi:CRP-like cAMP-binding protein